MRTLVVEDERHLNRMISEAILDEGYSVDSCFNGLEALELCECAEYDVIVLDIMMPKMDGFELVRRIRRRDSRTPVIFLTARTDTDDVVRGFETGANDYLRKPFGMRELIVRIKNLAGRGSTPEKEKEEKQTRFVIGNYQLDTLKEQLVFSADGGTPHTTALSHRESEILRRLAQHRGEVVASSDILIDLWGDDSYFNTRSLHVFITKLRHKLARDGSLRIINVRGIGYKLV